MSLDKVVQISITRATKVPFRAGFGVPAFMCFHVLNANLVNEVKSADEVLDLGGTVTHPAYKAALRCFSQPVSPEKMLIVKRGTFTQIVHLIPVKTTEGYVYKFTVVDPAGVETAISYTVLAGATVATISTALALLVDPVADVVATGVSATHVACTTTVGKIAGYKNLPPPAEMKVYDATVAGTAAADVATLLASLDAKKFYALTWDRIGEAEAMAAAPAIEAVRKMQFIDTSDSEAIDPADTDDVGSQLKALNYARTVPFYLANETNGLQSMGFMAKNLPSDPGSETWAHKTIVGIETDDLLTGQESALEAKKVNYYTEVGGLGATLWGTVPDGDYIDVIRFVDWLHARMGERIWGAFYNVSKIPFTDVGIAAIESLVRAQLDAGIKVGGLASYTLTVPKAADVEAADKAARTLPGIVFTAVLAGAIHKVTIVGTVGL